MQRNRGKQQNGKDSRSLQETKGIFNAKMGSIKDRNGMDLTEEEVVRIHRRNFVDVIKLRILRWGVRLSIWV